MGRFWFSKLWIVLAAALLILGVCLWVDLRLHPPPDVNEWFPMRVGDRWTYADADGGEPVVFEVVAHNDVAGIPLFVVDRRCGRDKVSFAVEVTQAGVWIHGTSKGVFSPPLQEFRFPLRDGDSWTYKGRFAGRALEVTYGTHSVKPTKCEVSESYSNTVANTRFTLEKGIGVTRLAGKVNDPHQTRSGPFDWKLQKLERRRPFKRTILVPEK